MQLIFFYLTLMIIQGGLTALLMPLPPPDLFLLGALTLLWRLSAWQMVLAYGVGLLQDIMGHGACFMRSGMLFAAVASRSTRADLPGFSL